MNKIDKVYVVNIVLMAAKMKVHGPNTQITCGDKGLCNIVKDIMRKHFSDVMVDCYPVFEDYMVKWARDNNPNWGQFSDIYPVPGQPGGGLNKECYYEARRAYELWSPDTEYGRRRHQMLYDLIKQTGEYIKCMTTKTE